MPTQRAQGSEDPDLDVRIVGDTPAVLGDSRDPLDIPYAERGVTPPTYYNPQKLGMTFYVNGWENGRSVVLWTGFVGYDGIYRYNTPREEQWVRANVSSHLGGGAPDRWTGDNLEEDDRWFCNDCQFTCLNTKVAMDHRRYFNHTERLAR